MIFLPKSQPSPLILTIEKLKISGTYNQPDVVFRLQEDFKNKCYICENGAPHSINIEHFKPHKNQDIDLKFDWSNLFYACAHCNNIKSARANFDDILNCTIETDGVETNIKYKLNPFPKEIPVITALRSESKVINTVVLLNEVYNGSTPQKKIESINIREKLLYDLIYFQNLLIKYFDRKRTSEQKLKYKNKIIWELSSESDFTAFKRWIIRDCTELYIEFGQYI